MPILCCPIGSWGLLALFRGCLPEIFSPTISLGSSSTILFSTNGLFLGLLFCLGLLTGCQRGFLGLGIWCLIKSLASGFHLLTIDLLTMTNWWVFGAYTLSCLMVSVYPIKVLFQVLQTFDLAHFSEEIGILILLPNIRMCLRFCLISIQVSSGMIIALSMHFVGNQFCK